MNGDLIAFAGNLEVFGTVKGNVLSAARSVTITGSVNGSVLSFCRNNRVSGAVDRNAYVFAQNATLDTGARIGGDYAAFTRTAELHGEIGQTADLYTKSATLDGTVGKGVTFSGSKLQVLTDAHITGDIRARIRDRSDLQMASGADIKGTVQRQIVPGRSFLWIGLGVVFWLAALFVIGLFVMRVAPQFLDHASTLALQPNWVTPLVGLAVLIVVPILLILLGLTVVGLPLALLGIALYFTIWLIAHVVIGEFLGHKLFHQRSNTLALLAGLLPIVVVAAVPVIGPISIAAVLLFGVGAISQTVARGVGAGSLPHSVAH